MTTVVRTEQRAAADHEGRGIEIMLPSSETAGTLAILQCHVPADTAGPPLHVHPGSDETFLVTAGVLLVWVDGRAVELGAGGLVHISRGTPHSFASTPALGAEFVIVHTPGGFDRFHAEAARIEHQSGAPLATEELIALAAGFDWQLAGPPLLPIGSLAGATT